MDALTEALPNAPNTINPSASDKRDSDRRKSTKWWRRKTPTIAASVAPADCPSAVMGGTGLKNATRNAPTITPGHTRYPYFKIAASAIPYAGHTGPRLLLLMFVVACPSLPATTYARQTIAIWTKYFRSVAQVVDWDVSPVSSIPTSLIE